mmetsp:Transcript_89620/g.256780  ORF Transcript_89620/g.256780 Transcript_89620/m.256780 type:complete len:220 (-) Transcript_89620:198-857(-)
MPRFSFSCCSFRLLSSKAFRASFLASCVPRPLAAAASRRGSSCGFDPLNASGLAAAVAGRIPLHSNFLQNSMVTEVSLRHDEQRQWPLDGASSSSSSPLSGAFFRTHKPLSFFSMAWLTSPRCRTARPTSSPRPPNVPFTPHPTTPLRPHFGPSLPSARACSGLEYSMVSRPHVCGFSNNCCFFFQRPFSSFSRSPLGRPRGFMSSTPGRRFSLRSDGN